MEILVYIILFIIIGRPIWDNLILPIVNYPLRIMNKKELPRIKQTKK